MEERKIDEEYIKRLQDHILLSQKTMSYSVERFDVLIISLATSGLLISIGFVKDVITDFRLVDPVLLKLSWLLFAGALIMNLISQVTGYFANDSALDISKDLLRVEQGKKSLINENKKEFQQKLFDWCTWTLNGGSLLCLITGIITLVIFISKYV